jgi:hypothetical protein
VNQLSNDDEILSNEALKPLLHSLCLEEQAECIVRKMSRHPNNLRSRPKNKKEEVHCNQHLSYYISDITGFLHRSRILRQFCATFLTSCTAHGSWDNFVLSSQPIFPTIHFNVTVQFLRLSKWPIRGRISASTVCAVHSHCVALAQLCAGSASYDKVSTLLLF